MGGLGASTLEGALNPSAIFKDRFSNINTAKAQIEKQRAKEQVREKLRLEFKELDKDKNDLVNFDEMYNFLQERLMVSRISTTFILS